MINCSLNMTTYENIENFPRNALSLVVLNIVQSLLLTILVFNETS